MVIHICIKTIIRQISTTLTTVTATEPQHLHMHCGEPRNNLHIHYLEGSQSKMSSA